MGIQGWCLEGECNLLKLGLKLLAHHRFRTEVLEAPLLYNDSIRPKNKLKSLTAHSLILPKGRLARAVQNLLVSSSIPDLRPIPVALDSTLSSTSVWSETHLCNGLFPLITCPETLQCLHPSLLLHLQHSHLNRNDPSRPPLGLGVASSVPLCNSPTAS